MSFPCPDVARVRTHFERLCDFGGRLSGTRSEREAIDYVKETLAALDHGQLAVHETEYDGWSSTEAWIEVAGQRHTVMPLPGSPSTAGIVTLEIVDAGRGTPEELEALGDRLKGKAVVVTHEYMFSGEHVHRSRKFDACLRAGAGAFIIANPWADSGVVSGGTSFGVPHDMPSFGVSKQTGDALREAAAQGGSMSFLLSAESGRKQAPTLDWRIAAPGDAGQEEVILCAHIDGHAPAESAIDNASGCAIVLAMAEALNSNPPASGRSVRVLIFSIEEWGLLASEAYVDLLSESDRARIAAVINLDSPAGDERLSAMTSGFAPLTKMVEDAAGKAGMRVGIHEPLVRNSDHYNFAAAGIPAMRIIAGFDDKSSNLRHVLTSNDKRELVTDAQLEAASRLTTALIALACTSEQGFR